MANFGGLGWEPEDYRSLKIVVEKTVKKGMVCGFEYRELLILDANDRLESLRPLGNEPSRIVKGRLTFLDGRGPLP